MHRGTGGQRVQRNRGTVGTEEQRNSVYSVTAAFCSFARVNNKKLRVA